MSETVNRIFVEKKPGFDVAARNLYSDIMAELNVERLEKLRVILRYDVTGISTVDFDEACRTILSEANADELYFDFPSDDSYVLVRELLTGTYDQRADSAEQCIKTLSHDTEPTVKTATIFMLYGELTDEDKAKIRSFLINPVECCEGSMELPFTLNEEAAEPADVAVLTDFLTLSRPDMEKLLSTMGLAMSIDDAMFVQEYYAKQGRCPTVTEIKVIDTYWSDHCRHTTFMTRLDSVTFSDDENGRMKKVWDEYLSERDKLYGDRIREKPVTLMDLATIATKLLKKEGKLNDLDASEEINACSIKVDAQIDGKTVPYLVMFKNETHNHPTEIEPFGGAATCLGGAIRDPLSGRAYVYMAMRVTGCANPKKPFSETLAGKLPQRAITLGAAAGYSSYGNQIGLATGHVSEVYHPGYEAKRMEVGAVIAAAPSENVVRERPNAGDIVLLVGGRTGRDGCGGATGASKAHNAKSLISCGAEVQKGNPLTERKIQRLFKNPDAAKLIKRCNDFGAGGVSVAVGELADGLDIDLDAVKKKYDGLDGTELAISESQERMAVVVSPENEEKFAQLARLENLECTKVATVTDDARMVMHWRGKTIVDIERAFLDTNGVIAHMNVDTSCKLPTFGSKTPDVKEHLINSLSSLNGCSQRGLVERFDSTVGANTVLMPFGGKYQATPMQAMAAKIPVASGNTTTGTLMAYGFDPYMSSESPFHGAIYAVAESVARIVCAGGEIDKVRLTFQEYFERLGTDPHRWGKPLSALLGAFLAQRRLHTAAIGGKDSMSGSFMDMDVPPTLISFAVAACNTNDVISGELKKAGNKLYCLKANYDADGVLDFDGFINMCRVLHTAIEQKTVVSAYTVGVGGIVPTVARQSFGNRLGVDFTDSSYIDCDKLPCSIIIETVDGGRFFADKGVDMFEVGTVIDKPEYRIHNTTIALSEAYDAFTGCLSSVFPTQHRETGNVDKLSYSERNTDKPSVKYAKPRVFVPVFPGTNCEFESIRAFERAGAIVNSRVFCNTAQGDIESSLRMLESEIKNAQIIMLPGGFSAGDEPDGSGKFIATLFRSDRVADCVRDMLNDRDGLMLGICNGFQTLIKLGLVPFGDIYPQEVDYPTLTFNSIGRHQSRIVRTRVCSVLSPWFSGLNVGDIISVPISHGEGRVVCPSHELFQAMQMSGQIATQYVDMDGNPSMDADYNPAGSFFAIEGMTSRDGRILGKMGHNERHTDGLLKNVEGNYDSKIFESGVKYFS